MLEKPFFQKLNYISDWIIRLVIINVLIITFSLPLLTAYASISAGFSLLHDYANDKHEHLFKGFFTYFKESIGKKLLIQSLLFLIIILGYVNITYYSQSMELNPSVFMNIGYFIMITLLGIIYAMVLYSFVVIKVFPQLRIITIFKLTAVLAGKFYFRTVLMMIVNIVPLLILSYPSLFPIFVFAGITLPMILVVYITQVPLHYVESLEVKDETRD